MSEYKYRNCKLTPTVFKELMIQLFDGKQFERREVVSRVVEYHKLHGGEIENKNYVAVFKKASSYLRESGLTHKGYGTWALTYKVPEVREIVSSTAEDDAIIADEEIGVGNKCVYVYYFETYRLFAEMRGKEEWPCKIGRTDVDPLQRILGQSQTCYPEKPHVALYMRCDDSATLEDAIQRVLTARGKAVSDAPGKEWFYTSPDKVRDIYNFIHKI